MRPPEAAGGRPKRERMLFMGSFKSGKSYAWLSIAARHQKSGSDAVFYVVDTDETCNEMVGWPPYEDLENVVWEEPHEWDALVDTTRRFLGKMRPQDWLIVDMVTPCYEWAQEHVLREIYGEDKDTLMARKMVEVMQAKNIDSPAKINMGQMMLDLIPWKLVSKRYNGWATSLIAQPGHLVLVSGQKEIWKGEKGPAAEQFGGTGVKPDAQAYTGHIVNEAIWFRAPKAGEPPRLNTVGIGARGGRPVLDGEPVKDFALQVLVGKYKWKVK